MALLELNNIYKSYQLDRQTIDVLKGINLQIESGQMITVVGPSGAGKSTLLHIMGTLDRPTAGTVLFRGQNVFGQSEKELAAFRNRTIGFVFQFHHLLPEFTALENVMMPALIARQKTGQVESRARQLLEKVGLTGRLTHKPGELSGGEQQRVAMARALMNNPELILADEPSGNLDQKNAADLHLLMKNLCRDEKKTFIIVTHNESLAELSDVKIRLQDGHVRF